MYFLLPSQWAPSETLTCMNLKTAKAGALLSRNMKPMMLRSWVLKQLSPKPSKKLQSNATPTLSHNTQRSQSKRRDAIKSHQLKTLIPVISDVFEERMKPGFVLCLQFHIIHREPPRVFNTKQTHFLICCSLPCSLLEHYINYINRTTGLNCLTLEMQSRSWQNGSREEELTVSVWLTDCNTKSLLLFQQFSSLEIDLKS